MSAYAVYDQFGAVLELRSIPPDEGVSFITLPNMPQNLMVRYYIDEDSLIPIPLAPSSKHTFDYAKKQWIDARRVEDVWLEIKAKRNTLLAECDWTQLPDVPAVTQLAWTAYRQGLRDITEQIDPFNVVWPDKPV